MDCFSRDLPGSTPTQRPPSLPLWLLELWQSRYQPDQDFRKEKTEEETEMEPEIKENPLETEPKAGTSNILKSLWFLPSTIPTWKSGQIVYGCASLLVLLLTILSLVLAQWPSQVFSGDPVLTTVAVLLLLLITGVTVIIWRQPQDPSPLHFKAPSVPRVLDPHLPGSPGAPCGALPLQRPKECNREEASSENRPRLWARAPADWSPSATFWESRDRFPGGSLITDAETRDFKI
ncbi:hypothetical protein AB1E18_013802 [Capra hircus]